MLTAAMVLSLFSRCTRWLNARRQYTRYCDSSARSTAQSSEIGRSGASHSFGGPTEGGIGWNTAPMAGAPAEGPAMDLLMGAPAIAGAPAEGPAMDLLMGAPVIAGADGAPAEGPAMMDLLMGAPAIAGADGAPAEGLAMMDLLMGAPAIAGAPAEGPAMDLLMGAKKSPATCTRAPLEGPAMALWTGAADDPAEAMETLAICASGLEELALALISWSKDRSPAMKRMMIVRKCFRKCLANLPGMIRTNSIA